jgi:peptidoglycan LD-endopeptidase CwlK
MPTITICDAVKPIRDNWEKIKSSYAKEVPGKLLALSCVYRPPEEQIALYAKGRTKGTDGKWIVTNKSMIVTNVDGITVIGAHNYKPARAIDVVVVESVTKKALWDEKWYLPIGHIVRECGLTWGGDWKSFKDYPHVEVPGYKTYVES